MRLEKDFNKVFFYENVYLAVQTLIVKWNRSWETKILKARLIQIRIQAWVRKTDKAGSGSEKSLRIHNTVSLILMNRQNS